MAAFKPFEMKAIRLLAAGVLNEETLDAIATMPKLDEYSYSGCGYFATLTHPGVPRERVVCTQPYIVGECQGIRSGFVVFLEDHQLTLECHSYGEPPVPASYREQDVRLTKFA